MYEEHMKYFRDNQIPKLRCILFQPTSSMLSHIGSISYFNEYNIIIFLFKPVPHIPLLSCGGGSVLFLKDGISGGGRVSFGRPPLSGTFPIRTLFTSH